MTITTPFEDKDWQAIELSEHTYPLYLALAAETPEASRFSLEELVKDYAFMVKHNRLAWTLLSRDDFNLYFMVPKYTALTHGWYKVRTKSQAEMLSDAMAKIVDEKIGERIWLAIQDTLNDMRSSGHANEVLTAVTKDKLITIVSEFVNDI